MMMKLEQLRPIFQLAASLCFLMQMLIAVQRYQSASTMQAQEVIKAHDLYAMPTVLVCHDDPFNYTALKEEGYNLYFDYFQGLTSFNQSILTWGGINNKTVDEVQKKIYKKLDFNAISLDRPHQKKTRFTVATGYCVQFDLDQMEHEHNTFSIYLKMTGSFRLYISDPHWDSYSSLFLGSQSGDIVHLSNTNARLEDLNLSYMQLTMSAKN